MHFGSLLRRKGTDVVASALPLAWRQEPELKMVWAGRELDNGIVERSRQSWGENAQRVHYLGALEQAELRRSPRRRSAVVPRE